MAKLSVSANVKYNLLVFCTVSILELVAAQRIPMNHQVLQTELTNQLIENFFNDCYVVKSRKQATPSFANTALKIPVIEINYDKMDHTRVVKHFSEARRHGLTIKNNRQCIVYYISLAGFEENNLERLHDLFQIKTLRIEATFSYLMITEFDTNELMKTFLLSRKLKTFQYRMFVQPLVEEDDMYIGFQLNRFCYFCLNGNPEIIQDDQTYMDVEEINEFVTIFPDMTKNFNGNVMRVIAPPAPPLVLITTSKTHPSKKDIHGQHGVILKSLARYFNFSYTLRTSPLTGVKFPNGTWNGIMGEILYDRADIGLSVATSYDRYQIVDVTTAVFYAFLVLVSTKPKPTFEWQAIFYPFKPNCWLAFIFSIALTFAVSKWLHNTSIKYEIPYAMKGKSKYEIMMKLKAEFMTNYKSFYVVVGNLLEQGPPFDFNTTPSRMFVTYWMFFAMIITTAYRSKLFTFLTFPTVEVPPSSFQELIASTYKFGMKHLGGIAIVFITKSPLSYVRNIGEKMEVINDKYSCIDRTFRGRFTCILYRAYIDYLMETRYWKIRHNFHISDFVSPPVGASWVLPKYAPWLPVFDKASFPIYEMGLADKYLYDYQVSIAQVLRAKAKGSNSTQDVFDLNTNFKNDDDAGPKPLVMANLYAAFFILFLGVAIGGIFLTFEIVRNNKYNKKIKDRQMKLKMQLRRKVKREKKGLPKGMRLSLRQVVKVIGPNTDDILELDSRPKKGAIFSTVALIRTIEHNYK